MFGHHVTINKASISDWFCELRRSSLNTHPICTILSAFELREHSQDHPHLKMRKYNFLVLVGLIMHILKGQYA